MNRCLAFVSLAGSASLAVAGPVTDPWPTEGSGQAAACDASDLSGWYATADTASDSVEIRDTRGGLLRTITRDDLSTRVGWMTLDGSADGPSALAWSDSGRLLFIAVHDDEPGGGGLGSDAVLRYDTVLDQLILYARTEISDRVDAPPSPALLHFRGTLYVGGDDGTLEIHRARRNDTSSLVPATVDLGGPARGLAADRVNGVLYAATDSELLRSTLAIEPAQFTTVGPLDDAVAVTHSDHFGGASTPGLFVLDRGGARVLRVPDLQAVGLQAFDPETYLSPGEPWHDLDATACGRLLAAGDAGASIVADDSDTRLGFEAWVAGEFAQVVSFAKGLIAPDGEPAGWVIDADVVPGLSRFHPASPDGAAWVVLALLMNDYLTGDPEAQGLVRTVLERYAGLAGDGIGPVRSADGIFLHWMDPWTGLTKAGWVDEHATLSTMKIVLAADRARRYYADDPAIVAAADAITGGVSNWGGYIQPGTDALHFVGAAGGGPSGGAAGGFHEGIIFIEQAAVYGGETASFDRWMDRASWPSTSFVNGYPLTTNWPGGHLAAFVSLYSWLVQRPFRDDPTWSAHIANLLGSSGAWTDDAGPRFMTVFSAGTTRPEWGGYNADSLGDHPGDITTFPSLMAFSADGSTAPAVSAYHAYRRGARQVFDGGATLLYRRSEVLPAYTPNSAGLPDVVLGGLGLAELIRPGAIDAVLSTPYNESFCPADLAPPSGVLDLADITAFTSSFVAGGGAADLAPPFGVLDLADISAFVAAFVAGCP